MPDILCGKIREQVDAFVDGELGASERAAVEAHCTRCDACANELRLAVRLRDELRRLPGLAPPAHVIDAAERKCGTSRVVSLPRRRAPFGLVAAVAAALALVAATLWYVDARHATRAPEFSDAEIRRASEGLALAFGYVERYGVEAADIVRDDVLGKRIVPRIERALATSRESAGDDAPPPGLKRDGPRSDVTSPAPGRS